MLVKGLRCLAAVLVVLGYACAGPEARRPAKEGAVLGEGDREGLAMGEEGWETLRQEMVRTQILGRGIRDTAVLRVMAEVPRHLFVPEASPREAYADRPFPISHGQTISQPYIVAYMAQAADLQPTDRVLEIGTGSGYGAAVLAGLAREVYTMEIIPELAERARKALEEAGIGNVEVRVGNGWLGWPEKAPFDAIVVTAAPPEIPRALVDQLAEGGVLVIPVGEWFQELQVLRKRGAELRLEASLPVRFVPMVGRPRDTLP